MKLKSLLVFLLLTIVTVGNAQMQMPPVPTDTAVRIGKLDNGLTYYIRYNNWPEHRANFYIAQKVGSIQEEESQRGLAHFLEHMCFNGTEHFPGNSVIEWCRSKGIEFGGDLNAYTSIDQTVYNIDNVPTKNQGVLDSCLLILRDWSAGLTLDPEEIDKERGVIHEEWRMRSSAESRLFERNLPKFYPGSKYGLRYPIGLMSVIDNFSYKELRDYYLKWYHPTNQGIIVVGDVDVDHTEQMIKKLFASVKNPDHEAKVIDEPVPDTAKPIIVVDKDKEKQSSQIGICFKHDVFPDSLKHTLGYIIYGYVRNAACSMLNNRYMEAAQKADCPYVGARASDEIYLMSKTKDAFGIDLAPKTMELSNKALAAALTEAKRASEYGFTATEYDRYKANMLSVLDKQYSNKDKRYSQQFYAECLGHFLTNDPMPSFDWYYTMMKQLVPSIPVDVINQYMKEALPKNDSNMVIYSFNNEKEGNVYPTEEGLMVAVNQARTAEISPYVDNVKNEPLMKNKPKPGKIVSEKKSDKFDFTELKLSNGATVLLKKTDYKKDQVNLFGQGPGGSSLYGSGDYVNLDAFNAVIGYSGLGEFSSTELQKALAGKIANADLAIGEKYMNISGSSTPKDAETMFQMSYLYFTDIKKDMDSFNNYIEQQKVSLKNRGLSPETAFLDSIKATIYGHDERLRPMTIDKLDQISYDRILQIAKERTKNANEWFFTVIGNYDESTIRDFVCQYIASLPSQKRVVKGYRVSCLVKENVDNYFTRKMETPKSDACIIWHNEKMPYTLENSIQADIAGQLLTAIYLNKIREEASAAYAVNAYASALIEDDYHLIQLTAVCPMKPEKKDIALKILNEEVPQMTKFNDAEQLEKVKNVMLKQADDNFKKNSYWGGVVRHYYKYGIDEHSDYKKLIEAQTPQKIAGFMKEFLENGVKVSVVMLPQ